MTQSGSGLAHLEGRPSGVAPSPCELALVHLIEDDDGVRQALGFALRSGGYRIALYSSADEFRSKQLPLQRSCIITDVRMPGMSGLQFLDWLASRPFRPPALVMSGYADVPLAVQAVKGGAIDVLEKPIHTAALLRAVETALTHYRPPEGSGDSDLNDLKAVFAALTPRQTEVLRGILAGKYNKVIAHELGLSVRTIEAYRAEIMTRTGTANVCELVRRAVQAGV